MYISFLFFLKLAKYSLTIIALLICAIQVNWSKIHIWLCLPDKPLHGTHVHTWQIPIIKKSSYGTPHLFYWHQMKRMYCFMCFSILISHVFYLLLFPYYPSTPQQTQTYQKNVVHSQACARQHFQQLIL